MLEERGSSDSGLSTSRVMSVPPVAFKELSTLHISSLIICNVDILIQKEPLVNGKQGRELLSFHMHGQMGGTHVNFMLLIMGLSLFTVAKKYNYPQQCAVIRTSAETAPAVARIGGTRNHTSQDSHTSSPTIAGGPSSPAVATAAPRLPPYRRQA